MFENFLSWRNKFLPGFCIHTFRVSLQSVNPTQMIVFLIVIYLFRTVIWACKTHVYLKKGVLYTTVYIYRLNMMAKWVPVYFLLKTNCSTYKDVMNRLYKNGIDKNRNSPQRSTIIHIITSDLIHCQILCLHKAT